jgi:hypothetical protein
MVSTPAPTATAPVQANRRNGRNGRSIRRRVVEGFTLLPQLRTSIDPMAAATPMILVRLHVNTDVCHVRLRGEPGRRQHDR